MAVESVGNLELPLGGVGGKLRSAREAAGLSRSDIAARTKIAERHLAAIEDGRFTALASRTYAVGFARTYARALGLDEKAIANEVREELGAMDGASEGGANPAYDPGDPSRIPGRSLAWGAAFAAFMVVIAVWFFWPSHYRPAISLPSLVHDEPPPARPIAVQPKPREQGQVVITSRVAGIWIKITDEAGLQIMQKEMALGESYAIPPGARGPLLSTARPDALVIAIDGRILPPLSDSAKAIMNVPVSANALLMRDTATAMPAPVAAPATNAAPPTRRMRSTTTATAVTPAAAPPSDTVVQPPGPPETSTTLE